MSKVYQFLQQQKNTSVTTYPEIPKMQSDHNLCSTKSNSLIFDYLVKKTNYSSLVNAE